MPKKRPEESNNQARQDFNAFWSHEKKLDYLMNLNVKLYIQDPSRKQYRDAIGASDLIDKLMINFVELQTIVLNPFVASDPNIFDDEHKKRERLEYRIHYVEHDFVNIPYPGLTPEQINARKSYHTFLLSDDFVRKVQYNSKVLTNIRTSFAEYAAPIDKANARDITKNHDFLYAKYFNETKSIKTLTEMLEL
jgi:hypothetical protein